MRYYYSILLLLTFTACGLRAVAQETIRYSGSTLSNVDYHHGQLQLAQGVHAIQVLRANREHPEMAPGTGGWTYNHAPMLAYWNNRFYLEYLSNPVGEHIPPGQTLLMTSADGQHWSDPVVIFPPYKVPDGTTKKDYPGVAKDLYAVMHQRMGFYVSGKKRFLALAYYGIALDAKDDPNDGNGIGRVVREIKADGTFGPIYFIRHNASWNGKKSDYPLYTESKDKGFVAACQELLANPLMMQQWVEEADRDDALIPLKKQFKAFSYYHLPDGRVVGLWKHALTSISSDGGKTWPNNPVRAPKFVNSNAKIWGQRTSDGHYATVYNPSEFRWPLAISTSADGLDYTNLLLVHGEITPMRYGGNYKSYGPQYVRGIEEGNGTPPDGNLWVTYSMNKEDLWVASVPVPVKDHEDTPVNEVFTTMPDGAELKAWNIYSPLWAPVSMVKKGSEKWLSLTDRDRYDFAKVERLVPPAKRMAVEFVVQAAQSHHGVLSVELQDGKGQAALRLAFDSTGTLSAKVGARWKNVTKYMPNQEYTIRVELYTDLRSYSVTVNGKAAGTYLLFAPVEQVERLVFRTGGPRFFFPTPETPADQTYDLPHSGDAVPPVNYLIKSLKTEELK